MKKVVEKTQTLNEVCMTVGIANEYRKKKKPTEAE